VCYSLYIFLNLQYLIIVILSCSIIQWQGAISRGEPNILHAKCHEQTSMKYAWSPGTRKEAFLSVLMWIFGFLAKFWSRKSGSSIIGFGSGSGRGAGHRSSHRSDHRSSRRSSQEFDRKSGSRSAANLNLNLNPSLTISNIRDWLEITRPKRIGMRGSPIGL